MIDIWVVKLISYLIFQGPVWSLHNLRPEDTLPLFTNFGDELKTQQPIGVDEPAANQPLIIPRVKLVEPSISKYYSCV